jgi:Family of unknown function (DUF6252)
MKKASKYFLIINLLFLTGCTPKEVLESIDGTNQTQPTSLPSITTNGSNTFGCLINNELFLPRKILSFSAQPSGNPIIASYIWSKNYSTNVETYRLNIQISNQFTRKYLNINFELNDLLMEGQIYDFGQNSFGNFNASYYNLINFSYATTNQTNGKIRIIKFDRVNAIISGTFWFNAVNNSGQVVQINEGRFDLQYTE